ncbi:TlpA family protein disulfide reductase [Glaciimonas soli]|uniref:Redoxin family protein n=1 Tax=Glaciimonas soli TaxID=2590999 RepID=A0A843YSN3_9BURK|nr:TlpA disulfide reductase family protein [Glaciimonas soli]MQR00518.1 redoxin family protein [Glaciimonas soli]
MSSHTTSATSHKPLWVKLIAAVVVIAIALFVTMSLSKTNPAPDVTFTNLKGEQISLKSLRGKVVMVNFWATSCTTCIGEMPQMVDTYNKYKGQGLDFVAVAMNYDPPNYVLNYADTRKLPFQVALDTNDKLAQSFGDVKLTPTTFVIDKQGNIIKRYVGAPEFAELHKLLDKALAA